VKAVGGVQIRVREKPGESVPVGPAAAPPQQGVPQPGPAKADGG
jgi:hypothetical protein